MFEFFSNIKENWPTISAILTAFSVAGGLSWRFILGGWKAVKQAKAEAELSADKAHRSATKIAGASKTLESLEFQIEQLTTRLATAEYALTRRDQDFERIEKLLDETQQTLETTVEELTKVQQRATEAEHKADRLTAVVKYQDEKIIEQDKKLGDYDRRLVEAFGANEQLAKENAQLKQTRPTKRRAPHEGAVESEGTMR
jgi:chromosome segregation ATPase